VFIKVSEQQDDVRPFDTRIHLKKRKKSVLHLEQESKRNNKIQVVRALVCRFVVAERAQTWATTSPIKLRTTRFTDVSDRKNSQCKKTLSGQSERKRAARRRSMSKRAARR